MIKKLTNENISDINKAIEPYDIIGRLDIRFENGVFTFKEVLADSVKRKCNPPYDGAEAEDYIDTPNRAAFLAYDGEKCIGQVLVARAWNRYAHIEDLTVAEAYRGKGIGTKLFSSAVNFAKENNLCGISLECQNVNVLASRFYLKMGMEIGSVNTKLYRHMGEPYDKEIAVFWYLDF